jgi:hypothetical protein
MQALDWIGSITWLVYVLFGTMTVASPLCTTLKVLYDGDYSVAVHNTEGHI